MEDEKGKWRSGVRGIETRSEPEGGKGCQEEEVAGRDVVGVRGVVFRVLLFIYHSLYDDD